MYWMNGMGFQINTMVMTIDWILGTRNGFWTNEINISTNEIDITLMEWILDQQNVYWTNVMGAGLIEWTLASGMDIRLVEWMLDQSNGYWTNAMGARLME